MSVSGVNMSQMQALTSRISDLERSVSFWNNAYVVFVLLTVFLAGGLFITQFFAIRKARELAVAQSSMLRLKDDELREKIASLNVQAESLKTEAEKAKEGIAITQTAAAQANERAARANERAAEANKVAEQERIARFKLEQKLAPRTLTVTQGNSLVAGLREFARRCPEDR